MSSASRNIRPAVGVITLLLAVSLVSPNDASEDLPPDLRVGAAAVNLKCDETMVLAGMIEARYCKDQEGELRAVAVVVEKPGQKKIAIVACDVLWIPRHLVDAALEQIESSTGIPPEHVLVNATHTHHAPSTAPAHDFGVSLPFCEELKRGIIRSVELANAKLENGESQFFFHLGEEKTVGGNSRLKLPDGNITWINPLAEAESNVVATGPFDSQLPVLDFRSPDGKTHALVFNHSTHTIGTRRGNVRSPSFYGLAAQELEEKIGGVVSFLEGASGSTHNITGVPVDEAVVRMKQAVLDARSQAQRHPVNRLAAIRKPFTFRVRKFDNAEEDRKIARYTTQYVPGPSDYIRGVFAKMRKQLQPHQGEERETWIQAMVIGDVAIVGVPAEYFTSLGIDIKQRSPFKYTYVAELANDWIGYLPDREGHKLGGYQTWMGLHSYAEIGTGERMADEVVALLNQLAAEEADEKIDSTDSGNEPTDALDLGKQPKPQTPVVEQKSFRLADEELRVELVACEPEVISPVAIAWDADGRMYVAEMVGYPASAGLGRIKRLEDLDDDGQYETVTIFADQLSFPTSVMPYRDGLLVTAAPDILFLRDTDGDGRADERHVEWTGFNAESQQLRANALHWGIDNWIYGANGRCDGEIRPGQDLTAQPISIRARDFRFRPGVSRFEAIAGQSQFGQAHDDRGNRFLSWNTTLARHVAIPDDYTRNSSVLASTAVVDLTPTDDLGEVFPISPPPIQFNSERANSFNALCGLTVYRGNALGEAYAGDLFAAESLTNLVTRRKLKARGLTFVTERTETGQEFLAAEDPWFHPVNLTTGPDGALYVVDFYREFVEHPRYVASEEIRQRVNWRNGFSHGRIWRIRHENSPITTAAPRLSEATTSQLIEHLDHPVGWWRDTSQRLLVERQDKLSVDPLRRLARGTESAIARLHALWTLHGLGALDEDTISQALTDENATMREHALRMCEPFVDQAPQILQSMISLAADSTERVRIQLALSTSAISNKEAKISLLSRLIVDSTGESWMTRAVLSSARTDVPRILLSVISTDSTWLEDPTDWQLQFLLQAAEASGELNISESTVAILDACLGSKDQAERLKSPGCLTIVCHLARGLANKGKHLADSMDGHYELSFDEFISACEVAAIDSDLNLSIRKAVVEMLRHGNAEQVGDTLIKLLDHEYPVELQALAAESLVALDQEELANRLFWNWNQRPSGIRRILIKASLGSLSGVTALLNAIQQGDVSSHEIPIEFETQLKQISNQTLAERIADLLTSSTQSDRSEVIAEYHGALNLSGNIKEGAALFHKHCLTCHSIQRFGKQIGPDLTGISARPSELVLADILDPNRQVSADFLAYLCLTVAGKSHVGLIVSETSDSVTLHTADDKQMTIRTPEIEELTASGTSLMPVGFEKKLSKQDMADLLAFLRRPQRRLLERVEQSTIQ